MKNEAIAQSIGLSAPAQSCEASTPNGNVGEPHPPILACYVMLQWHFANYSKIKD